ncbi:MAG: hypothetical protein WC440_06615 [Candidatus Omnitrophota bacterium]
MVTLAGDAEEGLPRSEDKLARRNGETSAAGPAKIQAPRKISNENKKLGNKKVARGCQICYNTFPFGRPALIAARK